jgi:carbon monoxide dehydrogenase subunit G
MKIPASYTFDATPQAVWDLLLDTEAIAACLPGCETLDPIGENKYRAELTMGIAAVTGRYQGTVEMCDLDPPHAYRLVVEGRGKPGFMKGSGALKLTAHEGGTLVEVEGEAQVGGTIARVGQRLLGGVSKMTMDRFFACLQGRLKQTQSPAMGSGA